MEKYELVLEQFLSNYKERPYFEGAVLCGSYASGNQTPESDIDVHIVMSDACEFRERGNVFIDGMLVEYFVNPVFKIEETMERDFKDYGGATANMYGYGKILYDRTGQVARLQQLALSYLDKGFAPLTEYQLKNDLYHIWDDMDEFLSAVKQGLSTHILYGQLVSHLVNLYMKHQGIGLQSMSKLEKLLSDEEFAWRYHLKKQPEEDFKALTLACLHANDRNKAKCIQNLYHFVIHKCGDFDIGQFKLIGQVKKD